MTLDITAGAGTFGDFSDKEIRTLVFETAQAFYRPAHDVLVAAHAERLREWADKSPRGYTAGSVPPAFDDAILAPVWAACLARARLHVSDMLGMDLALDASAPSLPQTEDASGLPPEVLN